MRRCRPPICVACTTVLLVLVLGCIRCTATTSGGESRSEPGPIAQPNDSAGNDDDHRAASYFAQADRLYVKQPAEIDNEQLAEAQSLWPSELTEKQWLLLRQWVTANSEALAQLKLGTEQADYLVSFNKYSMGDWQHGSAEGWEKRGKLTRAAIFRVKFAAAEEGLTDSVEEDLLMCYRVSVGRTQSPFLLEYLIGMKGLDYVLQAVLDILARMPCDETSLLRLQGAIGQLPSATVDGVPNFLWREKLWHHIQIATLFEGPNPDDALKSDDAVFLAMHFDLTADEMEALDVRRGRTTQDIEAAHAYCERFLSVTPWQAKTNGMDFYKDLASLTHENPLVTFCLFNAPGVARFRAHCAAKMGALAAILTLMRYERQNGEFPDSMQELVSGGYMSRLPADPYSDKPLVYRRTKTGFILYSLAEDFDDDEGQHSNWGRGKKGGDYVFWPVQARMTWDSQEE